MADQRGQLPSYDDLRLNHQFVLAFEALRKRHNARDMTDDVLREIAAQESVDYNQLRRCRHLRNALAHGDPVNRDALTECLPMLTRLEHLVSTSTTAAEARPGRTDPSPTAGAAHRAFRIHAWVDDELEQEMISNGFISMGGDEIGDLTSVHDQEEIRRTLLAAMTDRSPQAIAIFVGYWRRYLWEASVGDVIVLPLRDRTAMIGEIVGPYHYVAHAAQRARHRRAVAWRARVERSQLDSDLVRVLSSRHTIQEFKAPRSVERLLALTTSAQVM